MIQVKYSKIHIEGFRSIVSPISFDLDRTGVNLIQGTNGVGKSTIFNALFWCEYGINLKKSIEPWGELLTPKYRGTRVIVERSIGNKDYRICRHQNFKGTTLGLKGDSKLMIFEKENSEIAFTADHLISAKYKEDQQAEIINQLGIDDKTFLQSVVFGQKMSSLVETSPKDKREIFDTLFSVGFVDEANEKAKAERLRLSNDITTKEGSIATTRASITKDEGILASLKETAKNFDSNKKITIDNLEAGITKLAESLAERKEALKNAQTDFDGAKVPDKSIKEKYEAKKEEVENAEDEVSTANKKVKSAKNQITNSEGVTQELEEALENVKTECPTCKSPLSKDEINSAKATIKESIKKEVDVLKSMKKNLEEQVALHTKATELKDKLDVQLSKLKSDYDSYATDLATYNTLKNAIQPISDRIEELEGDLSEKKSSLKLEQEKTFDKTTIETLETSIKTSLESITSTEAEVEKLKSRLTKVEWWIKKGFGASGIKSFVFNSMLNQLNITAQKYAERLGFGVEFTVDMTKETRPFQMLIYKGSEVKDYDDLSGGQQQRVNVCISFAMHDLVSSSKTAINLLVMDEKFESLDQEGVEAAYELIRDKAKDRSVYVITHSEIIDVLNSKTIEVTMENGTTTINEK